MSITKRRFGALSDGREVCAFTLDNGRGLTAEICTYGGALMRLLVPDRNGRVDDVVCGYSSLDSYVGGDGYQGAVIGRVCNRISGGRFTLDGREYGLTRNDGNNTLHGGGLGFNAAVFSAETEDGDEPSLIFHHTSPDGDEGFPGELSLTVRYTLTAKNGLAIEYRATADRKTVVSLTNHSYFNLGGYASGSILGHTLFLDADAYLPTDAELIPTGEIRSVEGTALDFRCEKAIGRDFDLERPELENAGGYDHCLVFSDRGEGGCVLRGVLKDKVTGRVMRLYTDQPCVQLYSGNFLTNADYPFKGGLPQRKQSALCLETQKMPDSVNRPGFTDVSLFPGEVYLHRTVYEFSAEK